MSKNDASQEGRKPYYVSVQAGQILEDPQAAAYELEVYLNEREHIRLRELFDELSSVDEAEASIFALNPFNDGSDGEMNAGYDEIMKRIYKKLYEYGTDSTKRHIESMRLF